jgi:hypothetical protein
MQSHTPDGALALFDALPTVGSDEMMGDWRGGGFPTGHALDGVLENLRWRGKRFETAECAYPLVFARRSGATFAIDPARIPFRCALRCAGFARTAAAARLFAIVAPLLATTRPCARLRAIEYRGVVTAAMIYDAQPAIDVFRRLDAVTLLGLMDLRGMAQPFFFTLARDAGAFR